MWTYSELREVALSPVTEFLVFIVAAPFGLFLIGLLVVFGPVRLLGVAQRWLRGPMPWGPALARSAFGAFILQTPVLIGLAMALRGVDPPRSRHSPSQRAASP